MEFFGYFSWIFRNHLFIFQGSFPSSEIIFPDPALYLIRYLQKRGMEKKTYLTSENVFTY
ncbi:MAG: hypothetical protein COB67_13755 [SAR324 cluster bacterium]|uniref:Uncharacterized protein n=1 Tax=SAR324 cluster bacterium TaxID=2024889 RepID=A0A2A4SKY2_9DELT|nr:MAG: hypothetical protein COB67_13755 [SAR324 cluster bacterium]